MQKSIDQIDIGKAGILHSLANEPSLDQGKVVVLNTVAALAGDPLTQIIQSERFDVFRANHLSDVCALHTYWHPDCLVLRTRQLDESGLSQLKELLGITSTPVLIVSEDNNESRRVEALMSGADDCIQWPCSRQELSARLYVLIRRNRRTVSAQTMIRVQDLEIDPTSFQVFLNREPVRLTRKEFDVLLFLASPAGVVRSAEAILRQVWGPGNEHYIQTLRVHIANLRKKIENENPRKRYVGTASCMGYYLLKDSG